MKCMLIIYLVALVAATADAHRHPSSAPRTFENFLKLKIRNICGEVLELRQKVTDCCRQKGCVYNGKSYTVGAIFLAADECNICTCKSGAIVCTNSTGCGQGSGGQSYNYKDQIAQSYCASKAGEFATIKWVGAVRRDCGDTSGPTCDEICADNSTFASSLKSQFQDAAGCTFLEIAGLWFWMEHPRLSPNPGPDQPDAGDLNMVTVSYDSTSAGATGCGPNYCCCAALTCDLPD